MYFSRLPLNASLNYWYVYKHHMYSEKEKRITVTSHSLRVFIVEKRNFYVMFIKLNCVSCEENLDLGVLYHLFNVILGAQIFLWRKSKMDATSNAFPQNSFFKRLTKLVTIYLTDFLNMFYSWNTFVNTFCET